MDPSLILKAPKQGFEDGTAATFLHTLIVNQDVYKAFGTSATDDTRKKKISAFIASQICKQMFWDCDELDPNNLNNTLVRLSQLPTELRLQIYDYFLYENPVIRHHHVQDFTSHPRPATTAFALGMRYRQAHLNLLSNYPALYCEMLAEYLVKSLSLRDGIVSTANVCYAYSFDCGFDVFGFKVHELFCNPWGTWGNKNAKYLWFCLTSHVGADRDPENYNDSLAEFTSALEFAKSLERFEFEWRIRGRAAPVVTTGSEQRLREYGYVVGWKDGTDQWHVQYYTVPGVYSWGSHKIEGVAAEWTWSGDQLDLDSLPMFEWMH